MSGLRRMLAGKKGGFYVKGVDVVALKQGTETEYAYYVDIELSWELKQYATSGIPNTLSVLIQLGSMPNWGSAQLTRTISYGNLVNSYNLTYRIPVFRLSYKYTYCTLTITPKLGSTTFDTLPSIAVKVR